MPEYAPGQVNSPDVAYEVEQVITVQDNHRYIYMRPVHSLMGGKMFSLISDELCPISQITPHDYVA